MRPGKGANKCSLCGETFTSEMRLTAHCLSVHNEDKPFKCPECERSYGTRNAVRLHQRRRKAAGASSCGSPAKKVAPANESATAGWQAASSVASAITTPLSLGVTLASLKQHAGWERRPVRIMAERNENAERACTASADVHSQYESKYWEVQFNRSIMPQTPPNDDQEIPPEHLKILNESIDHFLEKSPPFDLSLLMGGKEITATQSSAARTACPNIQWGSFGDSSSKENIGVPANQSGIGARTQSPYIHQMMTTPYPSDDFDEFSARNHMNR